MNAITVFTDGSVKNNKAGSVVAIYNQNKLIGEITAPLGDDSIDFAELNAIFTLFDFFAGSSRPVGGSGPRISEILFLEF